MKKLRAMFLAATFAFVVGGSSLGLSMPSPVYAAGCSDATFLGLPVWYRGLTTKDSTGSKCEIDTEVTPQRMITTVAANIVDIIMRLVGLVSTGFIIYGGFLYMTAGGESSKIAGAKSAIMNATIGLIIAIFSVAIINLLSSRLI